MLAYTHTHTHTHTWTHTNTYYVMSPYWTLNHLMIEKQPQNLLKYSAEHCTSLLYSRRLAFYKFSSNCITFTHPSVCNSRCSMDKISFSQHSPHFYNCLCYQLSCLHIYRPFLFTVIHFIRMSLSCIYTMPHYHTSNIKLSDLYKISRLYVFGFRYSILQTDKDQGNNM